MARKKKNAGVVPLTSPQTREEHYLANIAGLVGTKPEYPFTRVERYLDAISGSTSGLDDRVTALEIGKLDVIGKGINLLDNAYFIGGGGTGKLPINQRGKPSYSGEGYGIDRWYFTNARSSMAINEGGIQITRTVEGSSIQFRQLFEQPVSGSQFTFSVLCTGRLTLGTVGIGLFDESGDFISDASVTVDGNLLPDGELADAYLLTATYSGSNSVSGLGITMSSRTAVGDYIKLFAAKMELGSQQTLARKVGNAWVLNDTSPNYQQELEKCQRYLLVLDGDGNSYSYREYIGSVTTTNQAGFYIPTPVTMSGTPSVSLLGTSPVFSQYYSSPAVSGDVTAIGVNHILSNGLYVLATCPGITSAGIVGLGLKGKVIISAELVKD